MKIIISFSVTFRDHTKLVPFNNRPNQTKILIIRGSIIVKKFVVGFQLSFVTQPEIPKLFD